MTRPHVPPHRTTFLHAFGAALASRLPGAWTSSHRVHHDADPFLLYDRIWDHGEVLNTVADYVLGHRMLLEGPDGQELCLIDRPRRRGRQFLITPLEPQAAPRHLYSVDPPHGIAVPADLARAAAAVVRRLLPAYQRALHAVDAHARRSPAPPFRPPPAEATRTVTLVWHQDGSVGTPYASVPDDARDVLLAHRFRYRLDETALVLPRVAEHAALLQEAARTLTRMRIGVGLRHASPAAQPIGRVSGPGRQR